MAPIRAMTRVSSSRSTGSAPREPVSSGKLLSSVSISRTSPGVTGRALTAESASTSTHIPPSPTTSVRPQVPSRTMPTSRSTPSARIGLTSTPSIGVPGAASATAVTICSYACAAASAEPTPSTTPPSRSCARDRGR